MMGMKLINLGLIIMWIAFNAVMIKIILLTFNVPGNILVKIFMLSIFISMNLMLLGDYLLIKNN